MTERRMSSRHNPSRRALLKALGVGPALLPMLAAERADAACAGISGPRRVFILVWPNGMFAANASSWATTGNDFVLPVHMKSLEEHRGDLLLLDGLDYKFITDGPHPETSGHACFQGMLTGAFYQSAGSGTANSVAGGISIDQHIGNGLRQQGYQGLTSLNLQVWGSSTARLSWRAAGDAVIPDYDPFHVFATAFGRQAIVAARKSVLDYVARDLNRFVKKVGGTEDRANVDAHLQHVREIEKRLDQLSASSGMGGSSGSTPPQSTACQRPELGAPLSASALKDTRNFELITKLQIDLAVAALAADATRVVVLQLGDQGNANIILYSLGFRPGGPNGNSGDINGLNSIAHANSTDKVICDTWFMDQVAYAIARLKDVSNGGTSLLGNTVLVGMNNMRTGLHEFLGVPAILAGSCGGYFKTGRSLKLASTPNNGLLIALANAAGVPTTTFGETIYGGELASLRGP